MTKRKGYCKHTCKNCKAEFSRVSNRYTYCSQKCFFDYKRKVKHTSICKTCEKKFDWRSNTRPQVYCSMECTKTTKHSMCEKCGNEFKRHANTRPQRFCSSSCMLEVVRKTDEEKETSRREGRLRLRYGIGVEDYNQMLIAQSGHCAICRTTRPRNNDEKKNFCVDHNHETGQVRGLLCNTCNTAIGMIGEDTELLRNAIGYLDYYNNSNES